jgi:hypothetical protein
MAIGSLKSYLYVLMLNGVNLDFLSIPLLIGASVMGLNSSKKVISIILGVIGLGVAGNRFIIITSSEGGFLAQSVGLGLYLVIGFAIINIIAAALND